MNIEKRRGGYLATAEGVKKLKEAKSSKKYTYKQIKDAAQVTIDQVKRLFNPQWGNGKYKISEEAVSLICDVLELKPEEIVNDWYAMAINSSDSELSQKEITDAITPYDKALQLIEQAVREEALELNLSVMDLTELPPEIGQLTNLTALSLEHNSLSNLPPEIGQLTNLTELYLDINSLSNLPPEIGQLANLTALSLEHNSLSSLPPEIGQLTNLTRLHLGNNSLSSLPSEIGRLTNLSKLTLHDNPFPIPPEIIKRYDEPDFIINYHLSLQTNQQKLLHEAKMLLVGQGNVGKTSVRERLIRNQFDPNRHKTDGIVIESWKVEINQDQYQINVWDFGGQEIMHSTHQFFLTKRSLYLLVIDTTLGEEENRIEYWLKIIQSYGKDSPVIIVGNKADQHPLDIDQRGLQQKYPQIKGFYKTACNQDQDNGIAELNAKVTQEIIKLEHIDDQLPLPWFKVKQKLENLKEDFDFIPYHEYKSLCESEEIDQSDNQHILIRLLNDLGIILNFQDDLRLEDTHVLNPDWVTNGVYKIINDYQLIVDYKGILELKMLRRILDRQRYPTNKHLFIIDMMRKFELCFDIERDQKFLIPDILPKAEPDTGEWQDSLAFEYHYDVLPGSIISRFIVRMSQWISKDTYWRSGVVLVKEVNRALVKADREDKKIIIRVIGKENTRRNLLTAIRSHFDYIHDTIPGILPGEKVPLLDYPDIPPVDYKWLLDLDNNHIQTIIPTGLTEEINIRQLLNGISSEENRRLRESNRSSNKIRKSTPKKVTKEVFISYSWAEESNKITDELDAAFQAQGITIVRDIRDAGYKAQISAFMESIGRGKCVVVVISKAYLESENCMFELLQIFKNGQFRDRIFPIVLPDAKIYKSLDRIQYVKYWEQEIKKLDEAMNSVSNANLQGFREDIDLYTEIRNIFSELANIIRDMNSLTVKIHSESEFSAMIEAVSAKLEE